MVLVGSNLPHVWKNDDLFLDEKANKKAQAICVKFLPDFAGKEFLNRPEMSGIKTLIDEKAPFGVKLMGTVREKVKAVMLKFPDMDVIQICYACGFNNISNFNKAFKKSMGVSPLVYKKRVSQFNPV